MASISQAAAEAADHSPMIEVRGVTKHFGPIHAVDGVDLDVAPGELFGLIGHNGAGKSTLFKMMLGLTPITSGSIRIAGRDIAGSDFRTVRRKVGYLPENVVLYDNLTGLETLLFFARLKHASPRDCAAALERVGLVQAAHRRVREYSKGMRQRLGFAQALLGNPQILFLDEPTNGLDPEAIREFYAILRGLRGEGVTVILTSHILAEIQERVDRLAIMASGRIQAVGTVQALRERMDLPLHIEVRAREEAMAELRSTLDALAVGDREERPDSILLKCRRDQKMGIVRALIALGTSIEDVVVREPSLEDVFFGFSD